MQRGTGLISLAYFASIVRGFLNEISCDCPEFYIDIFKKRDYDFCYQCNYRRYKKKIFMRDEMTQDKKTLLSKITKIIINASHPSKIILFGSQANDNQNPDSDYDILIIKDNIENERKITRVIYRSLYEHKISVPVDLIAVDSKKWELNKSNKYMIYYQAAEKGIVLYE